MRFPFRNLFFWKGGRRPKAEGITYWWFRMVCRTMLIFMAGCFNRIRQRHRAVFVSLFERVAHTGNSLDVLEVEKHEK
jgi:hypothetical protein